MDDLTIDAPVNITGLSHLINTSNMNTGFNPQTLEDQISGGQHVPKNNDLAQDVEAEINKLTSGFGSLTTPLERPSITTSDLDMLLASVDDDVEPQVQATQNAAKSTTFFPEDEPDDHNLAYVTNEQRRQNVIGAAFNDIDEERGSQPIFSVEKEKEEDEKARKLEGIESLREILEDEGENLSRVPQVTASSSLAEIDSVYSMLNLKNDRKRCCTFAEEGILLGANVVEWAFDGQKDYFGHKPDMTGWPKSIQSKLRRMRHDTSSVVTQVMQRYNLGSATRIALELIPSIFLYSRMRRNQHRDTLARGINDADYEVAMNRLRDADAPKEL